MKVLLDECLPRKLKQTLPGHYVFTVPEMGWATIKNGRLMRLVEPAFDVFITIDGNLTYQQNLKNRKFAIIVLTASDNTFETLSKLMPRVLLALQSIKPGDIVHVQ